MTTKERCQTGHLNRLFWSAISVTIFTSLLTTKGLVKGLKPVVATWTWNRARNTKQRDDANDTKTKYFVVITNGFIEKAK